MGIKIKLSSCWISLIFFLAILVLWMTQTKTIHESWNESTRLASMQALVEHGTWRIDASPYGHQTGDKMLLEGHYYSDKPPLFAAIGAFFYAIMYYGLDATLAIDGCRPGGLCVYYWLTVLMVGIPSALMAALFYKLVWRQIRVQSWAIGLTLLLFFGTVVWPYSLVLNHHLPAAIALFIGFYWLFIPNPKFYQVLLAGFLVGVAVMFDLTAIFLACSLFLIVMIYQRKYSLLFVGAALIPLLVTIVFNYQITGGILFAYFTGTGYNYPNSPWDTTVAGQHPPDHIPGYIFRSLVGDNGILTYSPLLILAIVGLGQVITGKSHHSAQEQVRSKSILITGGIIGHFLYVFTQTNNFGGDAYGWRFLIPVVPILYSFIIYVVLAYFFRHGGKWWAVLWGIAGLISIFSAYQGVKATWHQVRPPLFVNLVPESPYITIKTNLSLSDGKTVKHLQNQVVRNFQVPPISHRLNVNINNELMLLGYDLPTQRVQPGQDLEITLYWQSLRVVQGEYFVFTHLVDINQASPGKLDKPLQEGYPVAFWYPGEIVVDRRQIPVASEATLGLARLNIGVYELRDDRQIEQLPLFLPDSENAQTSLTLGSIIIGTPSQLVEPNQLKPQVPLSIKLGDPPIILWRGYDLIQDSDGLDVTFYWESLAPTSVDWTTFIHLQNNTGKIVAQKDAQTGGGTLPTSLWITGEIVSDTLRVPLPLNFKKEEYTLLGGLYRIDTGQRLAFSSSDTDVVQLMFINPKEK